MQKNNPTPNQILFSEALYCTAVITMQPDKRSDAQNLNLIERYFELLWYTFESIALDDAVFYLQTFDRFPWPRIAQFIKEKRHLCPVSKCTYFCILHFITSLQQNPTLRQLMYPDLGPNEDRLNVTSDDEYDILTVLGASGVDIHRICPNHWANMVLLMLRQAQVTTFLRFHNLIFYDQLNPLLLGNGLIKLLPIELQVLSHLLCSRIPFDRDKKWCTIWDI